MKGRVMHYITGTPLPSDTWRDTYKSVYYDPPTNAKVNGRWVWDIPTTPEAEYPLKEKRIE